MEKFRCDCSKLLFQKTESKLVIKCRHCKRYIIIHTLGIEGIEFANNVYPEMLKNDQREFAVHL